MKTVNQGKQWISDLLIEGSITNVISGVVYRDKRPIGSTKEDIVINSIAMDNSFLQDGVFNVNCYVPMLLKKINNIDQYLPNTVREDAISKAVYPILEKVFTSQYNLSIVNHNSFTEETEKVTYINFRINLKVYNNK